MRFRMQEIFVKYYICQTADQIWHYRILHRTISHRGSLFGLRIPLAICRLGVRIPAANKPKLLKQVVISRLPKRSATDMNVTGRGHHKTDIQCHIRCGKLRTAQCPSAPIIGFNLQQKWSLHMSENSREGLKTTCNRKNNNTQTKTCLENTCNTLRH